MSKNIVSTLDGRDLSCYAGSHRRRIQISRGLRRNPIKFVMRKGFIAMGTVGFFLSCSMIKKKTIKKNNKKK